MNKVHFKDPFCYLSLPSTVVESSLVTWEVEGSNTAFFAKIFFTYSVDSIELGKTQVRG